MLTRLTRILAGRYIYFLPYKEKCIYLLFNFRLIDNLTSRQLRANAEIRLPDNNRIGGNYDIPDLPSGVPSENDDISEELPSTFLEKWVLEREANKNLPPNWEKDADFESQDNDLLFPEPDYTRYKNLSIIEIFEKFIDEELISYLVEETRRYALFMNAADPNISTDEIKCFIGILFVSGYNNLPTKRSYWDSNDDMKNLAVLNAMRRDRFLQISRFIHFADNTKINPNDKAWKIRPMMELLKRRCIENFVPEKQLAYDESMVKYFGRHSCKQFIRGKPIRFGYKIWSLNSKDGYLVNFELYQGANPKANNTYDKLFGKAASPLLILLDELPSEKKELRYELFMDNLFCSPSLFSYLRFQGYSSIGTIRDNRMPKNCPITSKQNFAKKNRGSFETAVEKKDGLLFVRWMDNSVVTMISSSCGTKEISRVKRFSQQSKSNITIPRPRLIEKYNTFMGGTDQMDQNLGCYRIGIRGKKWYWPLITWMFDVALQNSWILYKKVNNSKISQLEFKREVAMVYLKRYQNPPKSAGRSSAPTQAFDNRVSDSIRLDRIDHFVKQTDGNKKRRCAMKNCKSIIRTMCVKCNVGLCINCFIPYHKP